MKKRILVLVLCIGMLSGNTAGVYADDNIALIEETETSESVQSDEPDAITDEIDTTVEEVGTTTGEIDTTIDEVDILENDNSIQEEPVVPNDQLETLPEQEAEVISAPEQNNDEDSDADSGELLLEPESTEIEEVRYQVAILKCEGGTISYSSNMSLPEKEYTDNVYIDDLRSFTAGTEIVFTVNSADGYELQEIKAESGSVSGKEYGVQYTDSAYVFVMPEDSIVISGVFVKSNIVWTDMENMTETNELRNDNLQKNEGEVTDEVELLKSEPENKEEKVNTTGEKNIKTNTAIRITPCLFSSVLGEAVAGNRITVEKVLNNWGKVKLDNGITGWVMLSMLEEVKEAEVYEEQPSTKIGYINVSAAIIRSKPIQSEDTIVAEISRNKSVEIMGEENDWYKILYEGKEAYIAKRLVSDNKVEEASRSGQQERVEIETPVESVTENKVEESKKIEEKKEETKVEAVPPTETKQEESAPAVATSKGEEVVALAKKYLGYSYVYGGSGPNSFDCSGFTQYIYKQFGISLAHSAVTQANNGTYVSKDNLMPGDLVIFRDWDNVSIGHCGIYIGGGQFIHAANSKRGVVTDTLNSGYYYERYVTGRRLL